MRHALPSVLLLALPIWATSACGVSQPAARDRASALVCERFERCGDIGEGKRYANRMSCEVRQAADWDRIFNPEDCEDRIDPDALARCLAAIDEAGCDSLQGRDLLEVLDRCRRENVCTGR